MTGLKNAAVLDSQIEVEPPDRTGTVILAVGDASAWQGRGQRTPSGYIAFAGFHEVNEGLLLDLNPTLVVSPLLGRTFDCVDLAQLLYLLGFRGKYRAIDDDLPDPDLIADEVSALVPGLDFAVTRL